jgi:hypothetical protein
VLTPAQNAAALASEHESNGEQATTSAEGAEEHGHSDAEHAHGDGEGEEGGHYIGRGESWDALRSGARLILAFDSASSRFTGTVQNTTESLLCAVRVEVHLSSGVELGPTAAKDVAAGQSMSIILPAGGRSFDRWTAHPEVSPCNFQW